jgi:SAM-dependent methyltransferase
MTDILTNDVPQVFPEEPGEFLGAAAALLEIGDRLGLLSHLESGHPVTVADLARSADLPEDGVANYLEATTAAGITEQAEGGPGTFRTVPGYARIRYNAGYVSWTMNANRPFITNAREFLLTPEKARKAYVREGRQVAVASEWIGSLGFYSAALATIVNARPRRVVDLGAGTARLLIDVLLRCPDATAVALDIDAAACAEAGHAAERAGVADRLTVIERPIQSIATDPAPVAGADIVHAGFVMHDLMPEEEHVADRLLLNCRDVMNPGGQMAITDAVPYVTNPPRERGFSAAMTYFHRHFMGRKLLTEQEWSAKLISAGFDEVSVIPHRLPSGRLYVARKR